MLLRVYQEWTNKFHSYLKPKEDDSLQDERVPERRVVLKRPVKAEKDWCYNRNLDLNVLRDVAQLVEEIRHRFSRISINTKCLNSKVLLSDDSSSAELMLKICIGGAFYNKYVKAAYKNED